MYKREDLEEWWRELEVMVDSERCRAIGVYKFKESELEELNEIERIIPKDNKKELNP